MKKAKRCMKIIIVLVVVLIVVLAAIYINHRIQLNREKVLRTPLGKIVEVDGHELRKNGVGIKKVFWKMLQMVNL